MSESAYATLQQVLDAAPFPDLDIALRRGRHIDLDDLELYAFLSETASFLEVFYRRFGCELIKASASYYYLLPTGDRLGRRQLSHGEMLVGQALALMYLDPATIQAAGVVSISQLIESLSNIVGQERLVASLNFRLKKAVSRDARIAQRHVRKEVGKAVRTLVRLGMIDALADDRLKLRVSVLRFTDPVRGLADQRAALATLIERGEVQLVSDLDGDTDAEPEEEEDGDDSHAG